MWIRQFTPAEKFCFGAMPHNRRKNPVPRQRDAGGALQAKKTEHAFLAFRPADNSPFRRHCSQKGNTRRPTLPMFCQYSTGERKRQWGISS